MSAKIGSANLVFGVTDETYGYVQNLEFSENADEQLVKDGAGDVVGAGFSGKVVTVSGEYIVIAAAGFGDPAAQVGTGTAITLTDTTSPGDIYISQATKSKTVDDFLKVSFTGKYFPDLA
tara:strand:- start:66 stop:425 length:360 start_codon:yes stop_codon:yes gene_type:complete